jgi:protein TonB
MPPTPNASEVARLAPEARPHPPAPVEQAPEAPVRQESGRDAAPAAQELTPEERRFQMTLQQELAMLHREQQPIGPSKAERKQALAEHFAQLEKRRLQPSFDAPGVYEPGPDRAGEGQNDGPGGKYRSIGSYGIKHFSYLLSLQRKIELVFSVPPFAPTNGAIGVPIVGFTIMRNGQLAEAILLRSSGYPELDKALVDAVKRAAPYNPFPEHLPDPSISIRVYANVS